MKKTIVTVFTIIIVLIVMGVLVNVVTGGSFFRTIGLAVAGPINNAWYAVAGQNADPLIDVEKILSDAGIQDGQRQDMDSVFGS